MNITNARLGVLSYALVSLALLTGPAEIAAAQSAEAKTPANASANTYGTGWQCDRGFRKADGGCVAVTVPAHAYLSERSYGQGWACDRGYRKDQATCVAVGLPEHAHLDFYGNDWDCNQPYRKRNHACTSGD